MSSSCKSASLVTKRAKRPVTHYRDGMTDASFRRLLIQRANESLKRRGIDTGPRMFDRPFGKGTG